MNIERRLSSGRSNQAVPLLVEIVERQDRVGSGGLINSRERVDELSQIGSMLKRVESQTAGQRDIAHPEAR